ncbi:elongin-B isoform X2 [Erinaceus europaeus]|uniref:Elongin-B isoform X2 n=1 Tax=Erinaceus europaeus TaxID=9365 RepID=A0ABM3VW09_ERIEU|nr:elongin-B isoform X2 [Erinaceus europaeus]
MAAGRWCPGLAASALKMAAGAGRGGPCAGHAGPRAGCWERGGARPRRRVEGRGAAAMDVFLMIRRHKTTIFTDAKESSTVFELKRIVEGILKRPPDEQRLYKDDQLLDDGKTLGECGFTSQTARPQAPATVGLAFRADEAFEALRIEPFSSPPELPDVMKPQDSGSSANEQAVQ